MMKVLIIEDEKLAVDKLRQTLLMVEPNAQIIGVAPTIELSVKWLRETSIKPDLILMDIELGDGQSFSIFDQTWIDCPVIFTTSYDEYALRAFKVNSIDYLLKPIQADELRAALDKLERLKGQKKEDQIWKIEGLVKELKSNISTKEYRTRFLVKYLQQLISIEVNNIAYFYCEDRVNFFTTANGKKYILDYTMDEIEQMVDPEHFFRINRSFLVSIKSIRQIESYFGNRLSLALLPSFEKPTIVSREKVNSFKIWMGK